LIVREKARIHTCTPAQGVRPSESYCSCFSPPNQTNKAVDSLHRTLDPCRCPPERSRREQVLSLRLKSTTDCRIDYLTEVRISSHAAVMLQEKGRSCPKAGALLRMACSSYLTVLQLESRFSIHLLQHYPFRSTRNQRSDCTPILATVRLYRILELDVFVFCPLTRTCHRRVDARDQAVMLSGTTLTFQSTRNLRGDCGPVLAPVC
jgi:hypothetical protein